MKYEELFKMMEKFKYTLNEPYVFWDFSGTADIIAEAYCEAHGIKNLKSLEDSEKKYNEYLSQITDCPIEEVVDGGNLRLIGDRFQEIFAGYLDEHVDLWCRYIKEYNLSDKLDFYMCINFKDINFDLEDLFVEFCAYQYYHEHHNERTIKRNCSIFNYFTKELKCTKLSKITKKQLDLFFRTELLEHEMRLPWVKNVLAFYKRLFQFALERDICKKNPMDRLDVTKYYPLCHFRFKPKFLTQENM